MKIIKDIWNKIKTFFKSLTSFLKKNIRKINDGVLNSITYIFSSFGLIVLLVLLVFIFKNGIGTFSWDLLVSNYHATTYNTKLTEDFKFHEFIDPELDDVYFSSKWGVGFKDETNKEGNKVVEIVYLDELSPLKNVINNGNGEIITITTGQYFESSILAGPNDEFISALGKSGAQNVSARFDEGVIINNLITSFAGGGIRGSIITTIYLIALTLVIALPLGICAAIYLSEYAPVNKITNAIRSMIDMISGIPSIVFGFVGSAIFIPFMDGTIGSEGGSIGSGALTLTIILLPVIIRTTEEGLKVVPKKYRDASLALGASESQTTFKVVVPNALSGILAATLLSIGRIIGESAALIYAVGTIIKDKVAVNESSTSLAVHIWKIMSGESPNFELASAISIVILLVVFVLSTFVKLATRRLNKRVEV